MFSESSEISEEVKAFLVEMQNFFNLTLTTSNLSQPSRAPTTFKWIGDQLEKTTKPVLQANCIKDIIQINWRFAASIYMIAQCLFSNQVSWAPIPDANAEDKFHLPIAVDIPGLAIKTTESTVLERNIAATIVAQSALTLIFFHELIHQIGGHFDIPKPSALGEDELLNLQALEAEADYQALTNWLHHTVHDASEKIEKLSESLPQAKTIHSALLGSRDSILNYCQLVLGLLYSFPDKRWTEEKMSGAEHPPRFIRYISAMRAVNFHLGIPKTDNAAYFLQGIISQSINMGLISGSPIPPPFDQLEAKAVFAWEARVGERSAKSLERRLDLKRPNFSRWGLDSKYVANGTEVQNVPNQ